MKTIQALAISSLLLTAFTLSAQDMGHQLQITFNKTSSVIFPQSISSVDRGSPDILAQKAKGVENVLQIKGARAKFPASNVTVITSEGRLYEFEVIYAESPSTLTLAIDYDGELVQAANTAMIFREDFTKSQMESVSKAIVLMDRETSIKSTTTHDIRLDLAGIYVENNTLLFHIRVINESALNYDVESFRLYIRDKQKMKRTASQEIEIKPNQSTGNKELIVANSNSNIVMAVDKFTIPDAKRFVIEITEKNGGRHFVMQVKNKLIVKAKPIK
jgi:conjugative transposon TraN protein